MLERAAERGELELRASGVRHRYQVHERPASIEALAASLGARFERRERAELLRLQQVVDLIEADECQVARLAEHFADALNGPCGHCSWCLRRAEGDGAALELPERQEQEIGDAQWQAAERLRDEHSEALDEPRALARFLCGLSSPRLTKARLTRHQLYGALADVPFAQVLERASGAPSST